MTRARRELVSLESTPYYHCICRCVRRAFLWGEDRQSDRNYDHRKGWVLERMSELQNVFAVDVCAYAVMSNHYHLVVRLDRKRAESWTDDEVLERWERLFHLPLLVVRYRTGEAKSAAEHDAARDLIATWRYRLADLSWYMRCLNEHLARRANEEDGCKGRFWEGRFKTQALLDEAAVLTCMSYVDLNPVRAGMADTPESSDFTSIQQRIVELGANPAADSRRLTLMRLEFHSKDPHENAFSFSTEDYLQLVDWAGRAIRGDKRGAIPPDLPQILLRLGIAPERYANHVRYGGRAHHSAVLGHVERIRETAQHMGRKFLKGLSSARMLYAHP